MWNIQGSIHKIISELYPGFSRLFLCIIKFVAVVMMKVSQKSKGEIRTKYVYSNLECEVEYISALKWWRSAVRVTQVFRLFHRLSLSLSLENTIKMYFFPPIEKRLRILHCLVRNSELTVSRQTFDIQNSSSSEYEESVSSGMYRHDIKQNGTNFSEGPVVSICRRNLVLLPQCITSHPKDGVGLVPRHHALWSGGTASCSLNTDITWRWKDKLVVPDWFCDEKKLTVACWTKKKCEGQAVGNVAV